MGESGAEPDGASDGADWRGYFGFEEPYENQADAIEAAIDAGKRRGYLAMEGPCGTGKTMAALTAGAWLVRETDRYDRVLVVTPVKQQLRQFVEDLRTANAGLEDPLDGIALVGKTDLCPYGRENVFAEGAGVHDRCEDLREATAGLVESEGRGETTRAAAGDAVVGGGTDDQWWDPRRASDLARAARPDVDAAGRPAGDTLSTAGASSPYRREQPRAPDELAGEGEPPLYCPFEADWYARNRGSPVGFEAGEGSVVTAGEFLPAAVERGTCPHRAMSVLLSEAEVVVGNYNHLFDPRTRPLLAPVLDERTFVVVDEAHRLEGRVRDLLSRRVGASSLVRARNDCEQLLARARQRREAEDEIRDRLSDHDVTLEALERAAEFYDDVLAWLRERVADYLDEEFGGGRDGDGDRRRAGWRADLGVLPEEDLEIPLRDPDAVERDELTAWAEREGYTGGDWRTLPAVGTAVETVLGDLEADRQCVAAAVGATMARWWETDHASHLREIELGHAPADGRTTTREWEQVYTPALYLFDCMPAEALRTVLDELGGGVLMSATLEPLDVFTRVSGLDALAADSDADHTGEGEGRPVATRTYDLPFPEENRASWIVDATAYTARNRGDPGEDTPVRDEYRQVLRAVARNPGNVLVGMPNYREAAWAGEYLREAVDKPVLVDESSSNEETEALKRRFFAGGGKVLVTSTRGTLTEGVDYDGDKLRACAVVGVPLANIGSPRIRAVRRAYGEAFGEDDAFAYALTVPAVRRARQAIGRVVRGADEVGVRILAGARYTPDAVHSVHGYLPAGERAEFVRMTPGFLDSQIRGFWQDRDAR